MKPTDLVGRKIVSVKPMEDATAKMMGWYKRPFVLTLDDGSILIPQCDDEGNDGGALDWFSLDGSVLLYTQ